MTTPADLSADLDHLGEMITARMTEYREMLALLDDLAEMVRPESNATSWTEIAWRARALVAKIKAGR